jgi:hypothetical protein
MLGKAIHGHVNVNGNDNLNVNVNVNVNGNASSTKNRLASALGQVPASKLLIASSFPKTSSNE